MATKFEQLQQKNVKLNLKGITNKSAAKKTAGEMLIDSILDFTQRGESPVENESFSALSQEYADNEKGGFTLPNLLLSGNMLDSVGHRSGMGNSVNVGIMRGIGKSVGKMRDQANGHNGIDGRSANVKRRFIPNNKQKFKAQEEVDDFLDSLRPVDLTPPDKPSVFEGITKTIDIEELTSTENILALLRDRSGS